MKRRNRETEKIMAVSERSHRGNNETVKGGMLIQGFYREAVKCDSPG
ncbi:MAG: hypothetical protein M0R39_08105 [Prolixibacteraceae bacterium]|nr:hypothetical protein [Prolixibacteraceae bacterium]